MSSLKKLSFLMVYLLIPLPIIGLHLGGWFSFLPFAIVFILIPLIDIFVHDPSNPSKEQEQELIQDNYYKYLTYAYVPAQIIMITYAAYVISTQHLLWNEWLGFTLSIGLISGGAGINLAHELMHKNNRTQQLLSRTLLVCVCYGHFFVEHVKGHHVRVATPEDPATAKLGQSFYQFIPRTLIGSFKSALHLEKKRMHQKGYSTWSFHNHFWWILSVPLIISILCLLLGGISVLAFFIVQSFTAIMTLELVNYIEHYGLERNKLENGLYEKVSPYHSWNANHWLTNAILFHLQRHSDHHTYGGRPYQILRHMEQSPQLPSGYLGMIVLALIPPLWRLIMDKRVVEYRRQLKYRELYR
ncbi:alkane 1-monooxygenase [Legionella quateirensis]|uniref:Alkane-1-monooxygenase n=1 Tax=Legionella quateirensis TaxID=45072 RepID=A0A378KYA9_9GAMM|nr:alkane 1-monooxygenase [Legionella quateirensis]KTD44864.1 alkane-1-monooxygenase [Legionella quateirensis]STY19513.1 alkane-1-monooxygenase [Legionella quateirensis]